MKECFVFEAMGKDKGQGNVKNNNLKWGFVQKVLTFGRSLMTHMHHFRSVRCCGGKGYITMASNMRIIMTQV
jgi:hypothetical protein